MTTSEMLALLSQRTKIKNDPKILNELRAAYQWVVNRVFKSADGPQLLVTVGEELPILVSATRDYDLESNLVGGTLLGLQTLWAQLPTETLFTRLIPREISHQDFIAMDSSTAANPKIATGYPIFYAVTNFGQVRFAPALPSGTVLRADYSILGAAPDPTTNPTQQDGTDLPSMFHHAMVNKATAHLFDTLDDDRAGGWETRALDVLNDAIYAAGKGTRTARPVETRPFRRGNRRRGI